jgi:hypothetical protein
MARPVQGVCKVNSLKYIQWVCRLVWVVINILNPFVQSASAAPYSRMTFVTCRNDWWEHEVRGLGGIHSKWPSYPPMNSWRLTTRHGASSWCHCQFLGDADYTPTFRSLGYIHLTTVRCALCNYVVSGCHSNELSIDHTLHEHGRVIGHERASSLFHCILSMLWVLIMFWCGYVKCNLLWNTDGLRLTVCVCYWWEMALNVAKDVLFDNM